jgi:hypothetical protein
MHTDLYSSEKPRRSPFWSLALSVLAATTLTSQASKADEGGVSMWLPGLFGSLAAVPQQQPGWQLVTTYYHTSVSAGADVSRAREVTIGNFPANLTATVNANLKANVDLGLFVSSYAFATPVFGAQASVGLMGVYGRNNTTLNGTLAGALSTPIGTVPFLRTDNINSSVDGVGDLFPQFALRWNAGVHNYMTYITGDVPVGSYSSTRLANIGIGHGAVDAGGGYTYFNPQTGHEFSAVLGFTGNFKNKDTQYKNGVDAHLDMGASQFLTKQWQVGLVGYVYNQLSCDSGSGDRVGCFESRVMGIGPQVGYMFPIGTEHQGYLNLKGYREFEAANRPDGWNVWLTLVIQPAAAPPPSPTGRMITK